MPKSIFLLVFLYAFGIAQKIDEICLLPTEIGTCDAAFPMWTFDTKTGRCIEFIYGGCGGNENNFETKADCEKQCPCSKCSGFMECERCFFEIEERLGLSGK